MRRSVLLSGFVFGCFLLLSGESNGAAVTGMTQVKVAAPVYAGATGKSTITFELDSTTKGYVSQTVTVTWIDFNTNPLVPYTSTFTVAPQPGKGPVNFDITWAATKGEIYRVDAKMTYNDAAGNPQSKSDFAQLKY
jgi:hypothetical protein